MRRRHGDPGEAEAHVAGDDAIGLSALLAAGAARDIAGPLAYARSNLEHLDAELAKHERDLQPGRVEELRRCLREATLGATQVADIVRELLPDAAIADESPSVDLHRLLISSIKVARTQRAHSARVVTEFDAVPQVIPSEMRLGRLFSSLLGIAARSVATAREPLIRVATRSSAGGHVEVEITDSGPGIAREQLALLFDRFAAPPAMTDEAALELVMCRRIVEAIGGSISVECRPGRGTTYRVIIPTEADHGPDDTAPQGGFAPAPLPIHVLSVIKDR